MRWTTKPQQDETKWHQWLAWYPIRLNSDIYEPGRWVWLETVWRRVLTYDWDGAPDWIYSLTPPE